MSFARTRCVPAIAIALAMLAGTTTLVHAGSGLELTHTNITGLPGDSVTSQIIFDNTSSTNIRGWSFGVCVDSGLVNVSTASSGSTTATANGGSAPEFESINFPPGGVTHGVVLCFSGCAELAPGTGYELLTIDYDIVGAEGASGQNCFCDTLGSPAIETLVADPVGTALFPALNCGTITILDPPEPVTGASCNPLLLTCSCDIAVSWTNTDTYDSIMIYRDGVLVSTLGGSATSYTSVGELGLHDFCIEPVRAGLTAAQACCSADCPDVSVPATGVSGLTCVVDDSTCIAAVSWTNTSDYLSLVVSVDGSPVATLAGTATSTNVLLGTPGTYEICINGETLCMDPIAEVCCTAVCTPIVVAEEFIRGDYNGDGLVNIADPIALLDFLFALGTIIDCNDALDGNDDGGVDIGDAVTMLSYLFDEGPEPPTPFVACGTDPTGDTLDCVSFPGC